MPTKLAKVIRREVVIDGEAFTVAISPEGIRMAKKRFRSGFALSWKALRDGHAGSGAGASATPRGRATRVPWK